MYMAECKSDFNGSCSSYMNHTQITCCDLTICNVYVAMVMYHCRQMLGQR